MHPAFTFGRGDIDALARDLVATPGAVGAGPSPTTQELWARLHRDGTGSNALLDDVRAHLPCPVCVEHFDAYRREHPPAFGRGWFPWTVAFHNAVNARLGKPVLPLGTASRIWSRR